MFTTRARTLFAVWVILAGSLSILVFTPQLAQATESNNFTDIAMSGSGQIVYAINTGGSIWKSADTGTSWSPLESAGTGDWSTIATSQDGSFVVAADSSTGYLNVSTDSGASWSEKTDAGQHPWTTVAVSSDGTKIRAIASDTISLFQSDDAGNTWSVNATLPDTIILGVDGCSTGPTNPCKVPSWAELTMSGSANKIAVLAQEAGPYDSGRVIFVSQDSGITWNEIQGCCRDQSTRRQITSSRSDTNWTILMGNYQSAPGFLRFNGSSWTRTELRVRESLGDTTTINTTTWRGFAISADGERAIFTGQYDGWEDGHAGKTQSLFTGSLSGELSGVFQNDTQGTYYDDVAISDDGRVRAALKKSSGEYIVSTDDGATFKRIRMIWPQLIPNISSQATFKDRYTLQITNYDTSYAWSVTTTSGTASIGETGVVTVLNPTETSTVEVTASKTGAPDGRGSYTAFSLVYHKNARATWAAVNGGGATSIFAAGNVHDIALSPTSGELYVAGTFINAGVDGNINYIARFDGTTWHPLGGPNLGTAPGTSGIYTLAFDSAGNLYAGGYFIDAGGLNPAGFIEKWNGSTWSSLGVSPLNDRVRNIEVLSDGRVLVAGDFTNAGGVTGANYLAEWNSNAWSKVGSTTLDNAVFDIEESRNGKLYIAGYFSDAGGDADADRVAIFNGTDWAALGSGFSNVSDTAMAIAVDDRTSNETVYLGGSFRTQSLFKFEDGAWNQIDLNFNGYVIDLKFVDKYGLFVAGRFATINMYATGLGVLNDDTWYAIGDNTNEYTGNMPAFSDELEAIEVASDGTIYVGGGFPSAASQPYTARLARTTSWTPLVVNNIPSSQSSGPSAAELERRRLEAERAAKQRAAWSQLIKNLESDSPITSSLAVDAGLESLNQSGIDFAYSILMNEEIEKRTSERFIQYVFTKAFLVQDLISSQPTIRSVKKLVNFDIFPSNLKYPNYTLFKVKKLPVEKRSSMEQIQAAITQTQIQLSIRQEKLRQLQTSGK